MAVVGGSGVGAFWSWRPAEASAADRLLALQVQEGLADSWLPDTGVVVSRVTGLETAVIDVAVNMRVDGVTVGTNVLTSASAPFAPDMVGLPMTVAGAGTRIVEQVLSVNAVVLSGPPLPAAVDRVFSEPVGLSAHTDGVTTGTNVLTSAGAPFAARHLGRRTTIDDQGTRVITAVTDASTIEVDGPALPAAVNRRFTLPVFASPRDRALTGAGGKIIDSRRSPAALAPTIVRWRVGGR